MPEKISIELGSIQKTQLFPLWGRAKETLKPDPLLVDSTAVEIINRIDYDFSAFENNLDESNEYGPTIRCLNIDRTIQQFLKRHPRATIVNIGCGLDTTFHRVDNGQLHWYDLDMPDSMELRNKLIEKTARVAQIECSVFDTAWFDKVIVEDNILFIAAGVFYYFEESQIKSLLVSMAKRFPGSEVVFDAASPLGVRILNQLVIKKGGMQKDSFLRWGLRNAKKLEGWHGSIKVLDQYAHFSNLKLSRAKQIRARLKIFLSDILRTVYMVHIRL